MSDLELGDVPGTDVSEEIENIPELPPEPVDEIEETEDVINGLKPDFSSVGLAIVRSNNRLYRVKPETLPKYKGAFITVDGPFALVDMDKHKVRPFLLSLLAQYEILPELKMLSKVFTGILVLVVLAMANLFWPGDGKKIDSLGVKFDQAITACKSSTVWPEFKSVPGTGSGSSPSKKLFLSE